MSRLPLESRDVWGQPGPNYLLAGWGPPAATCSHPFCGNNYFSQLEKHHLWPRSFLRGQPQNWVKLPDGRVVGNLVYLCREHHRQITENQARIYWARDNVFAWREGDDEFHPDFTDCPLKPQPPLSVSEVSGDRDVDCNAFPALEEPTEPPTVSDDSRLAIRDLKPGESLTGPPEPILPDVDPGVFSSPDFGTPPAPGEDCGCCGRRMPHPKKESSPKTSVVKSWRMPAEEKEAREETIAAVAEHLGISQKEKFWFDKLILALCVLALQGPGHE